MASSVSSFHLHLAGARAELEEKRRSWHFLLMLFYILDYHVGDMM